MKRIVRAVSVMLCAGAVMFGGSFSAAAEEPSEDINEKEQKTRGKASWYLTEADEETLYDDEALKAVGFTDEDIAVLDTGRDVTYAVKYDMAQPVTYPELGEGSEERLKIDEYYESRGETLTGLKDSIMTRFYAARLVGGEKTGELPDVSGVPARVKLALLEEQGDADEFAAGGHLDVLFLGGDKAVELDSVTTVQDELLVVDFTFAGEGDYMILFIGSEPDEETDEPEDTSSEPEAETASVTEEVSEAQDSSEAPKDANPKTGLGAGLVLLMIPCAAAVAAGRRTRR